MSLPINQGDFQHIQRICNTNVDGRVKVAYALTAIKGIGRRFATLICKKCEVDTNKRAGELTQEEIQKIVQVSYTSSSDEFRPHLRAAQVISNPQQFRIPQWFLNRQHDPVDGTYSQKYSNLLDASKREDLERMKKMRLHRGLRHYWGIRVRGQHTKTSGRGGVHADD